MKNKFIRKRFVASLLTSAMVLTSMPAFGAGFADTNNHWAVKQIDKWSDYGIVNGYEGNFNPDSSITRGEMAVIIDRIMNYQISAKNDFKDLDSNYYTDSILKIYNAGVMNGDGNGNVNPKDNITREQAAVLLAKAFSVDAAEGKTSFKDNSKISSWAMPYVTALTQKGYINGKPDGTFAPQDNLTRAEAITIIDNMLKALYNQAGVNDVKLTIEGTVVVNTPDVTLKNKIIAGDLIIAEGVGEGDLYLEDVTVLGKVIVKGGGENSIHIIGSSITSLIVAKTDGNVRIVTDGAKVETIFVNDGKDEIIIEGEIRNIQVNISDVKVIIQGAKVDSIELEAENSNLLLSKDTQIGKLSIDEKAKSSSIDIQGVVSEIEINAPEIEISADGKVEKITASVKSDGLVVKGDGKIKETDIKTEDVNIEIEETKDNSKDDDNKDDNNKDDNNKDDDNKDDDNKDDDNKDDDNKDDDNKDDDNKDDDNKDDGSKDDDNKDDDNKDDDNKDDDSKDDDNKDDNNKDDGSKDDDNKDDDNDIKQEKVTTAEKVISELVLDWNLPSELIEKIVNNLMPEGVTIKLDGLEAGENLQWNLIISCGEYSKTAILKLESVISDAKYKLNEIKFDSLMTEKEVEQILDNLEVSNKISLKLKKIDAQNNELKVVLGYEKYYTETITLNLSSEAEKTLSEAEIAVKKLKLDVSDDVKSKIKEVLPQGVTVQTDVDIENLKAVVTLKYNGYEKEVTIILTDEASKEEKEIAETLNEAVKAVEALNKKFDVSDGEEKISKAVKDAVYNVKDTAKVILEIKNLNATANITYKENDRTAEFTLTDKKAEAEEKLTEVESKVKELKLDVSEDVETKVAKVLPSGVTAEVEVNKTTLKATVKLNYNGYTKDTTITLTDKKAEAEEKLTEAETKVKELKLDVSEDVETKVAKVLPSGVTAEVEVNKTTLKATIKLSYNGYTKDTTITLTDKSSNEVEDVEDGTEINSFEEFEKIIKKAYETLQPVLKLKINNYDGDEYDLKKLNIDFAKSMSATYSLYSDYVEYTLNLTYSQAYKIVKALENDKAKSRLTEEDLEVLKKAEEIINTEITSGMTDFEKEVAIHDYLILNSKYDQENYKNNTVPDVSHTPYGLLINGTGVCDSYAGSFMLLLKMVGIESQIVTGTGDGGSHAWNVVKIENEYYMVDVTWDDPVPDKEGRVVYNYLNLTSEDLKKDHEWKESNYPVANGTKYNYYSYNNVVVESYEEYKTFINEKLNAGETVVEVYVKGFDEDTYTELSFTNRGCSISYSTTKNGNALVKITFN